MIRMSLFEVSLILTIVFVVGMGYYYWVKEKERDRELRHLNWEIRQLRHQMESLVEKQKEGQ